MSTRTRTPRHLGPASSMFESIMVATEMGLVVLGPRGRALYINPSAQRLLRTGDVLPRRVVEQLGPMLAHVRATAAPCLERWQSGELTLRARLRPLQSQDALLLLELSVVHGGADIVAVLAQSLAITPCDAKLLAHVWRGLSNDEIGTTLGVPEGTVKSRLHRLYKKHGLKNRRGAVLAVAELTRTTSAPAFNSA